MTVKRYTINGTKISLPIRKSDVASIQLLDTDLIIVSRDRVQHTLQNAALIAMSQPAFFVEYRDGRASGQQLIQQIGKTQQAKVSAATVRSQDKEVPDTADDAAPYQVIVQRTEGSALQLASPNSSGSVQAAPAPSVLPETSKPAQTASPAVAPQSTSFLAKFLGWTGLGLVAAALVAQTQEKEDSATDTTDPVDAPGLALVNITAVTDNRTDAALVIQQNSHSGSKEVLIGGSLSRALTAEEKIVFYSGTSGDERMIGESKPVGTAWTFALNNLAEGALSLKARVENTAELKGNWSNEWTWTVDSVAPTASARVTSLEDNEAPTIGTVPSGGITNDATPLLRGIVTETLGEGESVVVFGTFNDVTTSLGVAAVLQNNTWELQTSLPNITGTHAFTAQVRDRAGNTGPANFVADRYLIGLDQTSAGFARPDIRSVTDDRGSITGHVPSAGFTDDTLLELSGSIVGTLNAGELVRVYDFDTPLGLANVGTDLLSWTYTADLGEGPHQLRARIELPDGSSTGSFGSFGSFGSSLSFTVDTQAPVGVAMLTTVLDNLGDPATVLNGGSTDDPRSLIVGLVSNLQDGEFVTLFESDVRLGRAEVTGNTWVFTPTQEYALGWHSITARLEDAAGNAGALSDAYTFEVLAA